MRCGAESGKCEPWQVPERVGIESGDMVDDNNLRLGQTIFGNNRFERLVVQIFSHCRESGRESLGWGEEISEEKVVGKVEEGLEIKVEEKSEQRDWTRKPIRRLGRE